MSLRILITTQVFPPELHPTAVMTDQLSRALATLGHDVTVVCGLPHHPHGRVPSDFQFRFSSSEGRRRVVRMPHVTSTNMRFWARSGVMASQAAAIGLAARLVGDYDVALSFGPPLLGPLATRFAAPNARNISVIYDLYPDVVIEQGVLHDQRLIDALRAVEQQVYKASDEVVVLSEGFRRQVVSRGVPESKVQVIPVWLEEDEIRPLPRRNQWTASIDLPPEQKVVLYAGTVGLVSGAEVVLDAASLLRHREDVTILFVGEGRLKDGLEQRAREGGLKNVRFLPFQPREALPHVQACSDLSLVTLRPGAATNSVPSKVVGYFAAGRPVLAAVDAESDTAVSIVRGLCGKVVPPASPEALADAIQQMLDQPAALAEMGAAARVFFERNYAQSAVINRFVRCIEGRGP